MIFKDTFTPYPSAGDRQTVLPEVCTALLDEQKSSWPLLHDGWAALKTTKTREIACRGFSVQVQYNPQRLVSTAAKVDEQSVRERPCFLCPDHLPAEQKGIVYGDKFVILCNPAPIFHQHFTIALREHEPQAFEPWSNDFLMLTAALGPSMTLFYNGPRCGASAPDHVHFQACSSGIIPVERDMLNVSRKVALKTLDGVVVSTLNEYGRGIILVQSENMTECGRMIRRLVNIMRDLCNDPEEPMINVIGTFMEGGWTIVIIPRRKHRPSMFFADDRIVISPAAVDMGGLIITPREKDFHNLEAGLIESIYREVGVPMHRIHTIVERV